MDPASPNPFCALIAPNSTKSGAKSNLLEEKISNLVENVFLLTLNKDVRKNKQFIYMEEIASGLPSKLFNFDLLSHALFERLLLQTPEDFLLPNNVNNDQTAAVIEKRGLIYLFNCFERNENFRNNANDSIFRDACQKIAQLIFQNASTAIKQPDLYEGQCISDQILEIFQMSESDSEVKMAFLSETVKEVMATEESRDDGMSYLRIVFNPVFTSISKSTEKATLISLDKWIFPALHLFVQDKTNGDLASLLMEFITPKPRSNELKGVDFSNSLLGQLLNLSILPKREHLPFEYFENRNDANSNLKITLWEYSKFHLNNITVLIKGFLVVSGGGDLKTKMLTWIGNCLHANAKRGQIWNDDPLAREDLVSDAFMVNLCGVLLRLCQPLLRPQLKVVMVDPTYVSVVANDRGLKQVHMCDMEKETCLLPLEENEDRITANKYNFITEIFHFTHKAIDLGIRVSIDKWFQLNRALVETQNAYQESIGGPNSDLLLQMLTKHYQKFVSYLNTILGVINDGLLVDFYEATAIWLCQVVVRDEAGDPEKGFAPNSIKEIHLPVTKTNFRLLKSVPEFIFENIVGFFTFSKNFDTESIEIREDSQSAIFTMILVFMGSAERVKNPHLRARLAEGLECLLPKTNSSTHSYRNFTEKLFQNHPHRLEIVPNLIKVFVAIEMTGQSVQFEQKFNYRRPMYAIMEYLWKSEEQKQCFKSLAAEADNDMEAVDPPLFLRFINLLINDAIYLLDESLNNLQQIRTLQEAEDAGEWNNLSGQERQQNMGNLRHLGMMTRFDNILGRDTINLLVLLTTEIRATFCHHSMVDRVAAMLNYFLLHLVGPKKGNFKVS